MFLMTWHGTLIGRHEDGTLVQRPAAEGDLEALLELDLDLGGEPARFARCMAGSATQEVITARSRDGQAYEVHVQPDRRCVALRRDGLFLSAFPDNGAVEACRHDAAGWELFLCLTAQDVTDIAFVLANRWVLAGSNTLLDPALNPKSVRMGSRDYQLHLGETVLDLRYNLPFAARERTRTGSCLMVADVLVDGWRIERLHLYRPLIFLTAFRAAEYLQQARLCLASLLEFGLYDGAIQVISDHDQDVFLSFVPGLASGLLSVRVTEATDWVGYVASKYFILDEAAAYDFQPLLFLDPDVMADADIQPMLVAILTSARLLAPMEVFSGLCSAPSVGASLIQRAGASPRFASGFNGGTIGIPNLRAHAATLTLIRTILVNHLELHGRASFQWVDQEVANYVGYAAGGVDTATLLRFVRWGWDGCEHDATRRQGFVHFFPSRGGMPKSEAMRLYTQTLRAAGRRSVTAAPGGDTPA